MKEGKVVKKFKHHGQEVIFRYPKMSDLNDLLFLANVLVKERAYISMQKKLTRKKEAEWLKTSLKEIKAKKRIILVVEIDGKIMGNANINKSSLSVQSHVTSFGIILGREVRGVGLSEQLFQAIEKEAKTRFKIKIIKLNACSANKRAISFYRKMGFKEIGRIKKGIKHYGRYLDEVLMVKYL